MKNFMGQFDGYTSDQVRLALRSIPTDIALSLTEDQLEINLLILQRVSWNLENLLQKNLKNHMMLI